MDPNYWLQRWQNNEIGFHKSDAHPLLTEHLKKTALPAESRVFVPLCGKSHDLVWFLSQELQVVGAELSELAVEQFFSELKVAPEISELGNLRSFKAPQIEIFAGDFFELSKESLGPVDLIYDRAALVALPEKMRSRYSGHLKKITENASQTLICYEYDETRWSGPPFSVSFEEIKKHYESSYEIDRVATTEVPGGIRGLVPAHETIYHLKKKG